MGLTINVTFDPSVANAPAGFVADVNAAVQYFEAQFTDPVTINIDVGYGEVAGQALSGGALGESETYLSSYTYSQLYGALVADAKSATDMTATASLPGTNPTSTSTFYVPTAEAKALGLSHSTTSLDGYVGFSSAANIFDYNNSDGINAGQYDFYAVVLHEISEVLGRQMLTGSMSANEPLDLFHYSAPGVRDSSGTTPGYFSIDGGKTNLANFNTNSGGDFGDWASSAGNDAALAFANPGVVLPFSQTDLTLLDAIGWDRAQSSPPPPPTQPPVSLPDLTVSNFTVNGMTASYQVHDIGTGGAAASTTGIYLSTDATITSSDTLLATVSTPSLAAGGVDFETLALSLPTNLNPGTYYIGALADSTGKIAESTETNNASNAVPVILGNNANNTLIGTRGGNEIFDGGLGADTLYKVSKGGTDQFLYNAPNEGNDFIIGFGPGDVFDFSHGGNGLAVGAANTGLLDPSHFVTNTTGPTNRVQEFWYNPSDRTLYFDADGSGSAAAPVAIAHFQTNVLLTASNIHMV